MAAPVSSSNDQPDPLTPREPDPTITARPATAQNAPQPSPAAVPELIPAVPLDAAAVTGWITALAFMDHAVGDAELKDRISALEDLKAAAAAAQARATVRFDTSQRSAQKTAGLPADQIGKGIGTQIALARREPPIRGGRYLGLAKALVNEMPHTMAALAQGTLAEWRATLLVRETACLTLEDRQAVDTEIAADTGTLDGYSNDRITTEARRIAYRLDPHSVVDRARKAENDRHVSCRPAPDTMSYLSALLPAKTGVAVQATLTRHADTLKAAGDPRGRGQIMADTLVERITGTPTGVTGINLHLIMTDRTLLQGDSEPAYLPGYGIIPAQTARDLLTPPTPNPGKTGKTGDPVRTAGQNRVGSRERKNPDLAPPPLHRPRHRRPHRHGLQKTPPAPQHARPHPHPRRHLPHPLLRRPDPARRPHHPLAQNPDNHHRRIPRPLRSLQPNQRNPRLDRPTHPRPTPHHRNPHPHRPHLHLHRPTPARHPPHRNNASAYDAGQISAGGGDDERRQDDRHPKRHNGSLPLHTNSHRCEDQGHPAVQAAPNRFNASKAH